MCLLAIDGLSIIRRIHEAIPVPDSAEKMVGTTRSCIASFRRLLDEVNPTHAVIAMDFGGHTWRHDLFADYKKNRKPMPEHLKEGLPNLLTELQQIGLQQVCVKGVEADDTLAGLAKLWGEKKATPVVIASGDKDMCQLMSDQVKIRDHFTSAWRDEAWLQAKFAVKSSQFGDYLALMGDNVDGIPGVEKVGSKTAAGWLSEYGDLETIIANAASIKGKIGEYLRRDVEMARLSRQLVSFKTDFPLGLTWKMLQL